MSAILENAEINLRAALGNVQGGLPSGHHQRTLPPVSFSARPYQFG